MKGRKRWSEEGREGGRKRERVEESEEYRGSTVLSPPTFAHYQGLGLYTELPDILLQIQIKKYT